MARRIDELIKGRDLTGDQMAERFGVSPASITKWRKQGQITRAHLIELAHFFGVSIDYLPTGEYQWGETPQRRAWIEMIESLSPDQLRRFQAISDALVVADRDTAGNGD